jgi:hypothetical protein
MRHHVGELGGDDGDRLHAVRTPQATTSWPSARSSAISPFRKTG